MGVGFKHGAGGGAGKALGTLVISAPQGVTAMVTKDDKTYTKIVDDNGVAIFKGLTTGRWTATINNGSQTSTQYIDITLDYSIIMAFFASTISVTYPEGATCTCSDGVTTLTATGTGGSYVFTVPNTGTWNIVIENSSGQTASRSVKVTGDGQSFNVDIAFFAATISVTYPSGSTCTCSNGSIRYTATDTTGQYTFTVPSTGSWTIQITNGTNTKSSVVSITSDGQSESVTLSYIYWAFNKGNSVDYTGGWMSNTGSSAWSTYTPGTVIAVENGGSGPTWISHCGRINDTAIDLTGFSTLYITVSEYTSAGTAGITETSDVATSFVVSTSIDSAKTYAIDVSSYTGNYYIRMNSTGAQNNTSSYVTLGYRVSELWLE